MASLPLTLAQLQEIVTDAARHDMEARPPRYHPIAITEPIFAYGLGRFGESLRQSFIRAMWMRALLMYRRIFFHEAPHLLRPISPEENFDFAAYGIVAAELHAELGWDLMHPDQCCGPSADWKEEEYLRHSYLTFCRPYLARFRELVPAVKAIGHLHPLPLGKPWEQRRKTCAA